MNCDEFQPLLGPYLDSELDARTTLEVSRHLRTCPECSRRAAEEDLLDARLTTALARGGRTPELWARIERSVVASAQRTARAERSANVSALDSLQRSLLALLALSRAAWRRSPRAWAGLAAAWLAILALRLAAGSTDAPSGALQRAPAPSAIRFALEQKHILMADLAPTPDTASSGKTGTLTPGPRSDRFGQTHNT